jgi:hypothetical protein
MNTKRVIEKKHPKTQENDLAMPVKPKGQANCEAEELVCDKSVPFWQELENKLHDHYDGWETCDGFF